MNLLAEQHFQVQFVSICCDSLDGAREIIEKPSERRWSRVQHFFMDPKHKEEAKRLLGFRQVPFYVVVDTHGEITQMGSSRTVDFDQLQNLVVDHRENDTENMVHVVKDSKECLSNERPELGNIQTERVFIIEDLDF